MTGIPQGAVTRPAMVTARSAGNLKPSAGFGWRGAQVHHRDTIEFT